MRRRFFGLRLHEVAVLVAGVLVAAYAVWVVRDVGSSGPDVKPTTSVPRATEDVTVSPPKATPAASLPKVSKVRTLLVIGDSTGAGPGSWVDLVAQDLGKKRSVTLHQWDDTTEGFATPSPLYGAGRGLAIWNLSHPGVKNVYGRNLDRVPDKPDAVIVNIGHDRSPTSVERAASSITERIAQKWGAVPTAWVLQNPSTGDVARQQERAVRRVRAVATGAGDLVIDVHAAFRTSGVLDSLLVDDSHPNADGSRLWADVVGRAMGGRQQ